ncbi:BED zinc finger domain-containing protein [Ditylenchus destructor]|nr:BED zinc finger domain-containing protein [Ditylenchus destructor]
MTDQGSIWCYFSKIENGFVKCNYCSFVQKANSTGSTSNYVRHLENKHKDHYATRNRAIAKKRLAKERAVASVPCSDVSSLEASSSGGIKRSRTISTELPRIQDMDPAAIPENIICCICSASVKYVDLESHLAVLHFNSDPYQCDYDCNNPPSRFPTEAAIKEHMRVEHGTSDFSYRVWSNPEIDRAKENISNCVTQSVQNTLRFPETRVVSGMTLPTTYEMPQSRKRASTSAVTNIMAHGAAPPVILNGKSTISQLPATYEMLQNRNAAVQTPISAQPDESTRPKLITVTRTPTYQFDTTYEMPQSNIVVVRTPTLPPESVRPASASHSKNSEVEVVTLESDEELDVKPDDLRRSEFSQSDNSFPQLIPTKQAGTTYEKPQSCNAVIQTPISAPPHESAKRKLVTVTRAGNTTTYQLDTTEQMSQISNAVVQTSEYQKYRDMLNDRVTDFPPTFSASSVQVERNLDQVYSEDNVYSAKNSNARTRSNTELSTTLENGEFGRRSGATKDYDRNVVYPLNSNQGAKATALVDSTRPKELIQCRECRMWMLKKLGTAKTHINGMHLHLPLYKCSECNIEYDIYAHAIKHRKEGNIQWRETFIGEEHFIKDHPDKEKHWDMLNDRLKEFFPTFLASPAKLKRNLNFEKRVLGAVKIELDTELSSGPDLNPTSYAPGTSSSHGPSTSSGLSFTPPIKAEPEEVNEQAGTPYASIDEAIEKLLEKIQTAPEKDVSLAKFNRRFCRACRLNISCIQSKPEMYNHINLKHTRYPLYECAACKKTFHDYLCIDSTISKHIYECHYGDMSLIRDNRAEYDERLKQECIECFGMTSDFEPGTSLSNGPSTNSSSVHNVTPEVKTEPEAIIEQAEDFFPRTPDSEQGTSSNDGPIQPTPEKAVLPAKINLLFCRGCLVNVDGIPSMSTMYNHVNLSHTHYPLYECTACQKTFHDYEMSRTILNHVNEVHSSGRRTPIRDNRPMYEKQLLKRSIELFGLTQDSEPGTSSSHKQPTSHSKGAGKLIGSDFSKYDLLTKPKYMTCGGCQTVIGITTKPMVYSHINARHARFPIWECAACGKTYYDYCGGNMAKHNNAEHNGDKSLIRDNRSKYAQQLERKCIELFGMVL